MNVDWPSLLVGTGIGVVFGGLTSWGITHRYYLRQRRDAAVSERAIRTLLKAAERQGSVKLARDRSGNITGGELVTGVIDASLAELTASFEGVVRKAEKPTPDDE